MPYVVIQDATLSMKHTFNIPRGPPRAIQIQDSKDFAKSLLRFEIRVKISNL